MKPVMQWKPKAQQEAAHAKTELAHAKSDVAQAKTDVTHAEADEVQPAGDGRTAGSGARVSGVSGAGSAAVSSNHEKPEWAILLYQEWSATIRNRSSFLLDS
ncbi:hypothetical protein Dimus_037205 [Dionaea muscipula]